MSTFRIADYQPVRLQTAHSAAAPRLETASSSITTDRPVEATQPSRGRIVRLELLVVVFIVCFGYFAWRTSKQEATLREAGLSQNRSLLNLATLIASGDAKVTALTHSVEVVTATLAESTSKIGEVSDQLGQRQNELQSLDGRLHGVEISLRKNQEARLHAIDTMSPPPIEPRPSFSRAASPSNPHAHQVDMSIPMPGGVLAHQNFKGEMDYWMVSRMLPSGQLTVKVMPFGVNSLGVKIHSIDDGMDYILTPQGSWMDALESQR